MLNIFHVELYKPRWRRPAKDDKESLLACPSRTFLKNNPPFGWGKRCMNFRCGAANVAKGWNINCQKCSEQQHCQRNASMLLEPCENVRLSLACGTIASKCWYNYKSVSPHFRLHFAKPTKLLLKKVTEFNQRGKIVHNNDKRLTQGKSTTTER